MKHQEEVSEAILIISNPNQLSSVNAAVGLWLIFKGHLEKKVLMDNLLFNLFVLMFFLQVLTAELKKVIAFRTANLLDYTRKA